MALVSDNCVHLQSLSDALNAMLGDMETITIVTEFCI